MSVGRLFLLARFESREFEQSGFVEPLATPQACTDFRRYRSPVVERLVDDHDGDRASASAARARVLEHAH